MAPTLYNLYTCVIAVRWLDRVKTIECVGTLVVNRQDGWLFHRSVRNASETLLYVRASLVMTYVVLLACLREAACAAIEAYIEVARSLRLTVSFPVTRSLGLTVSFPKSKFMVFGAIVSVDDQQPLAVGGGLIEWVDLFPYLGSVIEDKGSIDAEVDRKIANACRAFGALHQSVFKPGARPACTWFLRIASVHECLHACVFTCVCLCVHP